MNKKLEKNGNGKQTNVELAQLIQVMKQENLDELEITEGETHIKLVREHRVQFMPRAGTPQPMSALSPASSDVQADVAEEQGVQVKAPIAGVFYRSPSPTTAPFVKEGDTILTGQILCIIEAMKVMNEIVAQSSGIVKKIKVENGKPVDSDQVLFVITSL